MGDQVQNESENKEGEDVRKENIDAAKKLLGAIAYTLYSAAAIYLSSAGIERLNVLNMESEILKYIAYGGALSTGFTLVVLPAAIGKWFKPGMQMIWGVFFWLLMLAVLALGFYGNDMLGEILPVVSPALVMLGWGIEFMLEEDKDKKQWQAKLEKEVERFEKSIRRVGNG